MSGAELTNKQVCAWFDVDELDYNTLDSIALVFKGAAKHATSDESGDDWMFGVPFVAAADVPGFRGTDDDPQTAPAAYIVVQHALLRVAGQTATLIGLPGDRMLEYGDVRRLEAAYAELGHALETLKAALAAEEEQHWPKNAQPDMGDNDT